MASKILERAVEGSMAIWALEGAGAPQHSPGSAIACQLIR